MKEDIQNHDKQIFKTIVSAMKIKSYDLCFCGSGKKYKNCCDKKNGESIVFTKKAFENVLKYKKSQGNKIQKIPQGLFKQFSESSLNRFRCLYPNCTNLTISCHLIPENILRTNFDDHCLESKPQDESNKSVFTKTGTGQAGTSPVFCTKHDNDLFQQIDELNINFKDQEHLFLLAFKSIAFSLRNVQYLMGIDSQVEVFRPILFLDNQKDISKGSHVELQISKHTSEQYLRMKITNDVFKESVKILEKKKYQEFSYFYRSFDYSGKIFFSSFINPLFDLNGKRINDSKTPINMTINIFTKDNKIHILLACPSKSKKLYNNLLKQLKEVDPKGLINFLNEIMKSAANKPLLPLDFNFENNFIKNS